MKFVNDIFLNNKKIGGVYCKSELCNSLKLEIGIGVNLNSGKEEFEKLPEGSSVKIETGKTIKIEEFFERLSQKLMANIQTLKD